MSWWSKLEDKAGGLWNRITGHSSAAERREQANMIGDQIKAYKEQFELTTQALNEARDQKDVQKRMINEKQIRALRNNFRPAGGFLNNQGLSAPSNTLSSESSMPSKLGA